MSIDALDPVSLALEVLPTVEVVEFGIGEAGPIDIQGLEATCFAFAVDALRGTLAVLFVVSAARQ